MVQERVDQTMTKTPSKKAALDPGFGGIKAASIQTEGTPNMHVVNIPASVGVGETDLFMLGVAGVATSASRATPYTVKWGETTMLVGPGVHDYTRPVERLDFDRLGDVPEMRALTCAALALLCGPGETTLALVVGLPVEVLDSDDAATMVRTLRKWLRGRLVFTLDQDFYILNVTQIKPAPQPLGTFLEWGFDDYGVWKRSKKDLMLPIAIMDIGFNSVDLFGVEGGKISRRYTVGQNLGIRRAAEAIKDLVKVDWSKDITKVQADDLIRRYIRTRGRTADLPIRRGATNIAPRIKNAVDLYAGELISFVEGQWGNGSAFSHILITGGGGILMAKYFSRLYPHAQLMPSPETANARGLAKLANRQGFLS